MSAAAGRAAAVAGSGDQSPITPSCGLSGRARDRYLQPLTAAGRQVTTKPQSRRTRRDSVHKPENRHLGGRRQAGRRAEKGLVPTRETGERDSRAAHQSGDACGSAVDRAFLQNATQHVPVRTRTDRKPWGSNKPLGPGITESRDSLRNPASSPNGEGGIHSSPFSALPDFLRFLTQCPCLSTTCDRWLALDRSGQIWQKSGPISTVSAQFSVGVLERVALSARGFLGAPGPAAVPASAAKGGAT